jgi:hypothetical protein
MGFSPQKDSVGLSGNGSQRLCKILKNVQLGEIFQNPVGKPPPSRSERVMGGA